MSGLPWDNIRKPTQPRRGFVILIEKVMADKTSDVAGPQISVIIEGFNETRSRGTVADTMLALRHQEFPIDQVEILLIGNREQTRDWKETYDGDTPFHAVRIIEAEAAHYLELKNLGAELASAPIVAFTDSDVCPKPTWLAAIAEGIANGADIVVGPSLFKAPDSWRSDSPTRQVTAVLTWGWIVGKTKNHQPPLPVGFMDHNCAFRAGIFQKNHYRTDLGRICGAPLLYRDLVNAGAKLALHPDQQAVHFFAWRYWLIGLHFRYGYEVYRLRRLDKNYPHRWIARTMILEPVITMIWHMLLDGPRWFRVSRLLRIHPVRRVLLLPLVGCLSAAARSAEMAGIVATLIAPNKMKRWAENV